MVHPSSWRHHRSVLTAFKRIPSFDGDFVNLGLIVGSLSNSLAGPSRDHYFGRVFSGFWLGLHSSHHSHSVRLRLLGMAYLRQRLHLWAQLGWSPCLVMIPGACLCSEVLVITGQQSRWPNRWLMPTLGKVVHDLSAAWFWGEVSALESSKSVAGHFGGAILTTTETKGPFYRIHARCLWKLMIGEQFGLE